MMQDCILLLALVFDKMNILLVSSVAKQHHSKIPKIPDGVVKIRV